MKKRIFMSKILSGITVLSMVFTMTLGGLGLKTVEARPTPVPASNPSLPESACGLDIALVLDNSFSIDSKDLGEMKTAFNGFVDTLSGTPIQFSVTYFNTEAHYTASLQDNFSSDPTSSISSITTSSGYTNWEDGLVKAQDTFDNARDGVSRLVIFASDGIPNRYGSGQGSGSDFNQVALDAAVTQANIIKGEGTRIITLGIGINSSDVAKMYAISDEGAYYDSSDFSELATTLQGIATDLCGGTMTITKMVNGEQPVAPEGAGWVFDVNGTEYTTTEGGQINFPLNNGTYDITEVSGPVDNYTFQNASCGSNGTPSENGVTGVNMTTDAIISCTFYNSVPVLGCTDPTAINYNEYATPGNEDAEDCTYPTMCKWNDQIPADDPGCVEPIPQCNIVSDTTNIIENGSNAVETWDGNTNWIQENILGPLAKWIWGSEYASDPVNGETQMFTKTFVLGGEIDSATIQIAADNGYILNINEQEVVNKIDEAVNFSTVTDPIDVKDYLVSGVNVINFTVHNFPQTNGSVSSNPGGLLYNLTVTSERCSEDGPVDFCPNIDGYQPELPSGMIKEEGMCVKVEISTITFNSDGGSAVDPITQEVGTTITPPTDPTKEGYTFNGWDPKLPETMPSEDLTVTAQWTVNQYTITFNSNGGSTVPSITQDYGTTVTAPTDPTKGGYTFGGWDNPVPGTMPAYDQTLNAQWNQIGQSTITFNSNGGSAVSPITQEIGTSVIPPANPTRTGYTFNGWSPELPTVMPESNLTVIAQWIAVQPTTYTLTYTAGTHGTISGDASQAVQEGNDGTKVTAVPDSGYKFVKWSDNVTTASRTDLDVKNDINVTATFTRKTSGGGGGSYVGSTPECSDGIDNDKDGLSDINDPGCYTDGNVNNPNSYNRLDNDEANGQVLGAEATCGIYVDKYVRRGYKNDVTTVKKIQTFLNDYMTSGLVVDGIFGPKTEAALKAFQTKHADKILTPWKLTAPTGIFYLTTQTEVNNIMCPDLKLPIPSNLIPFDQNPLVPKM